MATIIRDDGGEIYETRGGIKVTRQRRATPYADAIGSYIDRLDSRRDAVFSSNYEYPGRYTRGIRPSSIRRSALPASAARCGSRPITSAARCFWSFYIADKLKTVMDLTLGERTARRLDLVVQ